MKKSMVPIIITARRMRIKEAFVSRRDNMNFSDFSDFSALSCFSLGSGFFNSLFPGFPSSIFYLLSFMIWADTGVCPYNIPGQPRGAAPTILISIIQDQAVYFLYKFFPSVRIYDCFFTFLINLKRFLLFSFFFESLSQAEI
jgi:hypothetical protein